MQYNGTNEFFRRDFGTTDFAWLQKFSGCLNMLEIRYQIMVYIIIQKPVRTLFGNNAARTPGRKKNGDQKQNRFDYVLSFLQNCCLFVACLMHQSNCYCCLFSFFVPLFLTLVIRDAFFLFVTEFTLLGLCWFDLL